MPTDIWGNATWILFHTLSVQINSEKFKENKMELIEIIRSICTHLPCPICTADAINILNKAYINNIKTKEDFIEFLRQFHNIVNIKLGKQEFLKEEINKKYTRLNLINIINHFLNIFSKSSGNMKMIAYSFQRQKIIKELKPKLQKILIYCYSD